MVTRLCPRNEFETKSAKTFEIQTQAGCSKFKNICVGAFEDAWKLERGIALHVMNVAESYRQDRYGRSSINRSLSIRISCVISIVQKFSKHSKYHMARETNARAMYV